MDILVVIEDNNGKMHRMGLESISAAQSIAKNKDLSIGVLVMGANADELSNEASQYDVHEVLKLKNDILSSYSSDGYAEGVKQVIDQENPKYVLFGQILGKILVCPKNDPKIYELVSKKIIRKI